MARDPAATRARTFRLIGFPILSFVPKANLRDDSVLARMARHLLRAEVHPKPKTFGGMLRSLNDALADRDGHVVVDRARSPSSISTPYRDGSRTDFEGAARDLTAHLGREGFFVEESVVPEGAEVSVRGKHRTRAGLRGPLALSPPRRDVLGDIIARPPGARISDDSRRQ